MNSTETTKRYLVAIALVLVAWSLALVVPSAYIETVASLTLNSSVVGGGTGAPSTGIVTLSTGGHLASSRPDPDRQGRVAPGGAPLEGSREQVLDAYASLPLTFVENRGQTDTRVALPRAGLALRLLSHARGGRALVRGGNRWVI
jgi:hypothetical protein